MIDLVHDTIDSPFESLITNYICGQASTTSENISIYTYMNTDAKYNTTNFSTKYTAAVPALQKALQDLLDIYASKLK
jgi:hypothetical protein